MMNSEITEERIRLLQERHDLLDREIIRVESTHQNQMMIVDLKKKKLKLTNEEIFKKVQKHELVIVHTKGSMEPFLVDNDNEKYEVPEGYMEYDRKHFYKKII